ncbi:MAG: hypothetical protein AAFV51_10590 [Pseudomonadota bacterium]
MKKLLAATAAIAAMNGAASAAIIKMSFTGQLTSAGDPSGQNYFDGVTMVSGFFVFDSETPTTPFTPTQGRHFNAIQEVSFQMKDGAGATVYDIVDNGSSGSNIQVRNLGGLDGIQFIDSNEVPQVFANQPSTVTGIDYSLNLSGLNSFLNDITLSQNLDFDWLNTGSVDIFQVSFDDDFQGFDNINFALDSLVFEDVTPLAVSAPGAFALFSLGLLGLGVARRRS